MSIRIFPRESKADASSSAGGLPLLDTISDVLTLPDVGTDVNSVAVLDENTVYIYNANATYGDFEDTTNGGYWNKIISETSSDIGDQLSFDVDTPGTEELYELPDNIVVNQVTLNVYEVFDSGVQIELGTNTAPAQFMLFTENKPNKIGVYKSNPDTVYKNVRPNIYKLKINFLNLNGSTNGKCILTIEYSKIR